MPHPPRCVLPLGVCLFFHLGYMGFAGCALPPSLRSKLEKTWNCSGGLKKKQLLSLPVTSCQNAALMNLSTSVIHAGLNVTLHISKTLQPRNLQSGAVLQEYDHIPPGSQSTWDCSHFLDLFIWHLDLQGQRQGWELAQSRTSS